MALYSMPFNALHYTALHWNDLKQLQTKTVHCALHHALHYTHCALSWIVECTLTALNCTDHCAVCTVLHCTDSVYIALNNSIESKFSVSNQCCSTSLLCTELNYSTRHFITLHCNALLCTPLPALSSKQLVDLPIELLELLWDIARQVDLQTFYLEMLLLKSVWTYTCSDLLMFGLPNVWTYKCLDLQVSGYTYIWT